MQIVSITIVLYSGLTWWHGVNNFHMQEYYRQKEKEEDKEKVS
jgi:hypothetical protein